MLLQNFSPARVAYYTSPLLTRTGVRHAFSTRIGGVSPSPFLSLNLGNPLGAEFRDSDDNLRENYRRLQSAIGVEHLSRSWANQVHGAGVVSAGFCTESQSLGQADAVIGAGPDQLCVIRIADCIPVLLASEDGQVIAAAHAGWRGVVGGVVINTINAMRQRTTAPLVAAIGPGISFPNFEVGPEVVAEFMKVFHAPELIRRSTNPGKSLIDLPAALKIQLRKLGLSDAQIDSTDRCTYRDVDEFYSHRRDNGVTGRMAAMIAGSV